RPGADLAESGRRQSKAIDPRRHPRSRAGAGIDQSAALSRGMADWFDRYQRRGGWSTHRTTPVLIKTQFGPVEGHVALVEMLAALKREFLPDLEVSDEGGYW